MPIQLSLTKKSRFIHLHTLNFNMEIGICKIIFTPFSHAHSSTFDYLLLETQTSDAKNGVPGVLSDDMYHAVSTTLCADSSQVSAAGVVYRVHCGARPSPLLSWH